MLAKELPTETFNNVPLTTSLNKHSFDKNIKAAHKIIRILKDNFVVRNESGGYIQNIQDDIVCEIHGNWKINYKPDTNARLIRCQVCNTPIPRKGRLIIHDKTLVKLIEEAFTHDFSDLLPRTFYEINEEFYINEMRIMLQRNDFL